MNKDQLYGLARTAFVAFMTWLVSSGKLTSDQASTLISALEQAAPVIAALGAAAWGVWAKRDAAKAVAADAVKGVSVYVDPVVAAPAVVAAARAETNDVKVIGDPA